MQGNELAEAVGYCALPAGALYVGIHSGCHCSCGPAGRRGQLPREALHARWPGPLRAQSARRLAVCPMRAPILGVGNGRRFRESQGQLCVAEHVSERPYPDITLSRMDETERTGRSPRCKSETPSRHPGWGPKGRKELKASVAKADIVSDWQPPLRRGRSHEPTSGRRS